MKLKGVLAAAAVLLLGSVQAASAEQTFNVRGYEIVVHYEQKGDSLNVNGYVKGGSSCNQLNLDFFLGNSGTSGLAHVSTAIVPYKSHSPHSYRGSDSVYTERKFRYNWFIKDIYVKCF